MRNLRWMVLLMVVLAAFGITAQNDEDMDDMLAVETDDVIVVSDGMDYESYLAAPAAEGVYPGIVLIHSFNGLQQGYRDMTDQFAAEGFVVLAVGWQTFERGPSDAVVAQLLADSVAFLSERDDVDADAIGLTGFCAGGRYTMRFVSDVEGFAAGVAWYGFPNAGDPLSATDVIDDLEDPMLIIHGTFDIPSPVTTIYEYATALNAANKSFELKVYQGEPHGFMLVEGELNTDDVAMDAFDEMIDYFERKLLGGDA